MSAFRCVSCLGAYPEGEIPHCCPTCGNSFTWFSLPDRPQLELENCQPGIWRYRKALALPDTAEMITLGEGQTPLLWITWRGEPLGLKMESYNPTGSYKDRGTAALVSFLKSRGVNEAVEDSSGNAGASFAAYAARAGIKARVFVPESASGPKRTQIELFGADLVTVPGPRSAAAQAVMAEVKRGAVYASHAYLPFGLPGIATIAYELWEQAGTVPGTVIAPVGHGGLLLGIVRGFQALIKAGFTATLPDFWGVQAENCSPVVAAFRSGSERVRAAEEGATLAEGIRVVHPVRGQELLREISGHGGFVAVDDARIAAAHRFLCQQGIYVEPTSAVTYAALEKLGPLKKPVILILTGTGLKYRANH
ncbi:MAG TPA: pyridoxal-phosphate dependent enzyme [Anaerolineaceae bacterium]